MNEVFAEVLIEFMYQMLIFSNPATMEFKSGYGPALPSPGFDQCASVNDGDCVDLGHSYFVEFGYPIEDQLKWIITVGATQNPFNANNFSQQANLAFNALGINSRTISQLNTDRPYITQYGILTGLGYAYQMPFRGLRWNSSAALGFAVNRTPSTFFVLEDANEQYHFSHQSNEQEARLAWQMTTGLSYLVTPGVSVSLDYRLSLNRQEFKFDISNGGNRTFNDVQYNGKLHSHQLLLGLNVAGWDTPAYR